MSYLIPDIQQHDILLIQVILVEVCNLCGKERASLVGALKEAWDDVAVCLLESNDRHRE